MNAVRINAVRLTALAFAVTLGVACQTTGSGGGMGAAIARSRAMGGDSTRATVRIENNAFWDADIYVISDGGARQRLGSVTGNQSAVFAIPNSLILGPGTPLRFLADPIGGRGNSVSDRISVSPGDEVTLRIPPS